MVAPWRVTVRFHDIPLDRVLELPVEPAQAREAATRHFRGRLKQVGGFVGGLIAWVWVWASNGDRVRFRFII